MTVFSWNSILSILNGDSTEDFLKGAKTGISVGSYDGLHQGHRKILSGLVDRCRKSGLLSGVVTFQRPLPSIKHSQNYMGDLTTLRQRLTCFEEIGLDFVIVVDFDDSFASMLGTDFLNILYNICNMQLIAEGIDFRCGYKGATDTQAIRYWANQNGVDCIFVDPVYYNEGRDDEERISSSYIRSMIQKGFFTTAAQLLERPYTLDLTIIKEGKTTQILPPDGIYQTKTDKGDFFRLEIKKACLVGLEKTEAKSLAFL